MEWTKAMREVFLKATEHRSLARLSSYEENIDEAGNVFGTKKPELFLAQQMIDKAAARDVTRKIEAWDAFFRWTKEKRVVFVK
jgi:hypothetical protein